MTFQDENVIIHDEIHVDISHTQQFNSEINTTLERLLGTSTRWSLKPFKKKNRNFKGIKNFFFKYGTFW